jgi:hypothetical protein
MRCLERDELWFDRHPALAFCLSMIPRVKPEGMLFGKPDSTFPDHALAEYAHVRHRRYVVQAERETR